MNDFKILFFLAIVVLGCQNNSYNKLIVHKNYKESIDSLVVTINHKTIANINLINKLDTTLYYPSKNILTGHDVIIYAITYKDGKIADSFFNFNDLNYLPRKIEIRILNKGKLEIDFKNN